MNLWKADKYFNPDGTLTQKTKTGEPQEVFYKPKESPQKIVFGKLYKEKISMENLLPINPGNRPGASPRKRVGEGKG